MKKGNPESWIPEIKTAAIKNKRLKINLSRDEWTRLTKGGFTKLKKQLPGSANGRLFLVKEADRNYLLLVKSN